ncbi:polyisoprenyl-teichoic acid--peptidoglycan teichoic acid transferase [Staphylococcus schweitzeri]|uniref:Cell envelope-related function transcriptional attenuator common domain-containing protein n=1 Tax=Staphylococcus schweitzeri TaxID=1654388 RepID=A0A077UIB5_9STAP|nr:polyisoprenyl-teichoic acid--peptidoglycan teichoic acid transferase [Staphylococcus schweitzeri]CDR23869.1 cell envelope-related function transcriptional attenuator common domain-containing protein [Staphylococcus schweitzeri]CDR28199.1 cell envelope-related function transcriptional attenuator common domain-containing protein [Staphylococcus schweitzeri]CDR65622.1 cell envelope-related function transcriptional attenuator common domain-containing protein [Staphylococcus schweitzeri]
MNKFLKYFLILLALVLIVVPIVYATLLFKTSQDAFESSQDSKNANRQSNLRDKKVNPEEQPISILFLGIDDNDGRRKKGQDAEHSRSDAMILTTFNQNKHQIRMLSIPRDTISYIPKVGYYDKITHAHAYGGPIAAMDSVEATMNVPVDYYVRINMKAFVEAVNELGGIYYDVPYDLNEPNTDDTGKIKIKKGYQKLNGDEALAVARTRHHDSDLKRGQRQMELIKILFQKAQEVDSIDKLDNVIQIVGKNAKHNLTNSEIKALAKMYLTNDVKIKTAQLKGKDDMLNGIYYYHPSVESIQKYANLLREDLELSPINDKNDFLDQRVINHYGSLIPLTPLDSSLLRKEQNDTTDKEKDKSSEDNSDSNSQQQSGTDQNTNQNQNNVQQAPQSSNNQNGVIN